MEFRTVTDTSVFTRQHDYSRDGLSLGSCFAENIAGRMQRVKLPVISNPFGVLYNPASIASALDILSENREFGPGDLVRDRGLWSSFNFHGKFSSMDRQEALAFMNASVDEGSKVLRSADYVIITFGTAWVYELAEIFYADNMHGNEECVCPFPAGHVVANCHKFPARYFTRRRMTVEEIVLRYSGLIDNGCLSGKHIILTVSPVRHLKDGFAGNSVSKATLILAAAQLAGRYENVDYFPAYEIMNDDLRDYRFYAGDMIHPSQVAVDYICERFSDSFLSDDAKLIGASVNKIVSAAAHRPLNPSSPEYAEFRRSMLRKAMELTRMHPEIDLSSEIYFFKEGLCSHRILPGVCL